MKNGESRIKATGTAVQNHVGYFFGASTMVVVVRPTETAWASEGLFPHNKHRIKLHFPTTRLQKHPLIMNPRRHGSCWPQTTHGVGHSHTGKKIKKSNNTVGSCRWSSLNYLSFSTPLRANALRVCLALYFHLPHFSTRLNQINNWQYKKTDPSLVDRARRFNVSFISTDRREQRLSVCLSVVKPWFESRPFLRTSISQKTTTTSHQSIILDNTTNIKKQVVVLRIFWWSKTIDQCDKQGVDSFLQVSKNQSTTPKTIRRMSHLSNPQTQRTLWVIVVLVVFIVVVLVVVALGLWRSNML